MEFTEDFILNESIKIIQPKHGYRVAIDPILLADQVELKKNQSILDVGCGVGTISLILKYLENSQAVTSIDIDKNMIEFCKKNSEINNLPLNIIHHGIDFDFFKNMNFDCVVTNPPFYDSNNFRISKTKKFANFETIDVKTWLLFCVKRLKPGGHLYVIHLAEKLPQILSAISNKVGKIEIIPIYSYQNSNAKRIIVKCKKGSKESLKILPPIISHDETGNYSSSLKKILNGNFSQN